MGSSDMRWQVRVDKRTPKFPFGQPIGEYTALAAAESCATDQRRFNPIIVWELRGGRRTAYKLFEQAV